MQCGNLIKAPSVFFCLSVSSFFTSFICLAPPLRLNQMDIRITGANDSIQGENGGWNSFRKSVFSSTRINHQLTSVAALHEVDFQLNFKCDNTSCFVYFCPCVRFIYWLPVLKFQTLNVICSFLSAAESVWLVFTLCISVCVIMAKPGPGDTVAVAGSTTGTVLYCSTSTVVLTTHVMRL